MPKSLPIPRTAAERKQFERALLIAHGWQDSECETLADVAKLEPYDAERIAAYVPDPNEVPQMCSFDGSIWFRTVPAAPGVNGGIVLPDGRPE